MNYRISIIIMAVLFLAACKDTPEDLNKKAEARWQAIIDNDYEKAFEYFSPAYRKTEKYLSFALRMQKAKLKVNWTAVKYMSKSCETESTCSVSLELSFTYQFEQRSQGSIETDSIVKESWMLKDGKWYMVPLVSGV
ncbi:MAG: hypothetical protein L3J52_02795, partial [Proteobacteria bacterium]|nr:hypothetical protein [Pseudomonadota bacterium]